MQLFGNILLLASLDVQLETLFSIIIVCVDYDERSVNYTLCRKHGLTSSPRFCTTFRKFSRNIVDVLESIVYGYVMRRANSFNPVADDLFEFFFDILPNNKYYMVESSLNRIMN